MAELPGPQAPDDGEPPRVALLEADPELARYVARSELARARRAVTVPLLVLPEGPFEPSAMFRSVGSHPFAAIILSGLVARELSVGGQPTLRLLGPGDPIRCDDLQLGLLSPEESYSASLPTRLAVLDDRFLQAVRHWPRLLTALIERTGEHHDATLVQMAISQQPRVEDRLVALFCALAERWGRVTTEGVVVSLSLTHEALGRLIGARRPTVTLALKALAADERLVRRRGGAWVLTEVDHVRAAGALQPLSGAARPGLVPAPAPLEERAVPGPSLLDPRLVSQMRWLRHTHEALLARRRALAERTEESRAMAQATVAASRARRAARTTAPAASATAAA